MLHLHAKLHALAAHSLTAIWTCMPQVITALGSLEELAIKNSRLSAFPDQLIDMSGTLGKGCASEAR